MDQTAAIHRANPTNTILVRTFAKLISFPLSRTAQKGYTSSESGCWEFDITDADRGQRSKRQKKIALFRSTFPGDGRVCSLALQRGPKDDSWRRIFPQDDFVQMGGREIHRKRRRMSTTAAHIVSIRKAKLKRALSRNTNARMTERQQTAMTAHSEAARLLTCTRNHSVGSS
jgi:hypothetical protein